MSKAREFIESLEDFELAFLCYYRLNEFLPASQNIIKEDIEKRGLTPEMMKELILLKKKELFDFNNKNIQCSYCKSDKFFTKNEEYIEDRRSNLLDSIFGAQRVVKLITKKTCSVCGKKYEVSNSDFEKINH